MSKIDELIKELCPEGVEFKELGEILDYEQPGKYIVKSTGYNNSFKTPVLTAGKSFFLGYTNEDFGIFKAKNNPVIIFDDFTTSFHWVDFNFKIKSSAMKILKLKKDVDYDFRYIYYAMKCLGYQPQDHARHWISKYSTFEIPLPPLPIQKEIVKILDQFTELEENLTKELEERKKEYEYYREELLSFEEEDVEWRGLEKLSKNISSGGTPLTTNREYYNGEIPWLRTQEVDWKLINDTEIKISKDAVRYSSAKWIPENCIIIAMYGATAGKACINKIPLTTNQACCNIEINQNLAHYKYIYYWAFNNYLKIKNLGVGTQSNLNAGMIKKLRIPLPHPNDPKKSLEIQQQIVEKLEKFDELVNEVLPKEIELRRKQYEFYREKLLTFEELKNE